MALVWNAVDPVDATQSVGARVAAGVELAFAVSRHPSGEHASPHRHDYEQISLVVSGEIWFFVEGSAYRLGSGDMIRVPRGAVHWTWVRGREDCVCHEAFTPRPGLGVGVGATPLLAEGEARFDLLDGPSRIDAPYPAGDVERIEALEPATHAAYDQQTSTWSSQ